MRPLPGDRLILATHNPGKVREFADLLRPFGIAATGAAALGLDAPEEDGDSFVANALLKARAATRATGLPALADDSGLAVAALGGRPGIRSARWAGPGRNFAAAMARVNRELGDAADRSARFVCALALVRPGGGEAAFTGAVDGRLVWPPRGRGGFGYDPMFVPEGHAATFAEMDAAAKHALSHRARAMECLAAAVAAGDA